MVPVLPPEHAAECQPSVMSPTATPPARHAWDCRRLGDSGTFITQMSKGNVHPAMLMGIVGHYELDAVDLNSPYFESDEGIEKLTALRDTF